jgi:hypothetical protein
MMHLVGRSDLDDITIRQQNETSDVERMKSTTRELPARYNGSWNAMSAIEEPRTSPPLTQFMPREASPCRPGLVSTQAERRHSGDFPVRCDALTGSGWWSAGRVSKSTGPGPRHN